MINKTLPFEDPAQSKNKYSEWLMPWIRNRIAHNMDVLGLFVGPRGSGKSYSAMELAHTCDATFNKDRIFFDVTEFVDFVIDGTLKRGNATILDDAGVFMNSRDWQSVQNKAVSVITQSFRYRNLITFITVPKWDYIDRQTRGLINIFFEATAAQGIFKVKIPKPDPYHRGEDFMVYPTVQIPNMSKKSVNMTIKTVRYGMPPQWLTESYEQKRNEEIRKKQKEVQETLHALAEKRSAETKPKRKMNPNSIRNLKHQKNFD